MALFKYASALVLAGPIATWTPIARAQSNKTAAAALFDEGRAALQRNELDLACAKFKESDRLDPAIGTTFNLANCEEQRGHLAAASTLFRQAAARMQPEDQRLPIANARIQSLESRIPHVVFAAS
jgi:tetratricopeptide (TPR) repeat protein